MSDFSVSISGARYGELTVLEQVTMTVPAAGMLALLGANGAGKTTSLRAAIGVVAAAKRSVVLDGQDLSRLPAWKLPHAGVVLVPDGARCFPNVSVFDNLRGAYAAVHPRRDAAQFKRLYDEITRFFPILGERAAQDAGTMSGGQRQMLAVGRALMAQPKVLMLDEPSAGLAPKIVEELFETLALIRQERGCTVILAEQNVACAQRLGGDCIVLEEGHMALAGKMSEVLSDTRLRTAYLGL